MKTIPAFSLARTVAANKKQLMAALENVIDSQQFIGGKFVETFEQELARYLGAKHIISCNSGTDALSMALDVMQMPQNAIVLTTPFSFIASSSEIRALGANPVFIDIEPETFNIDTNLLEKWLSKEAIMRDGNTYHRATNYPVVGILPVDLYGQSANFAALNSIAKKWNLWIVEDCAQAIGATYNGQKAGTLGTIGIISFYPTKNLGAFGDAGCCVTNDDRLAEKLLQLRNIGRKKSPNAYDYVSLGVNSRLDAFQAAILSYRLQSLDDINKRRHAIATRYNTAFSHLPFIKIPREITGTHVYHQYSIIVEHENGTPLRAELEKHLAAHGVQSRIFYPQSLASYSFLQNNSALTTANPITDYVTQRILSLPMWPELEDAEVDYVIESVVSMPYEKRIESSMKSVGL